MAEVSPSDCQDSPRRLNWYSRDEASLLKNVQEEETRIRLPRWTRVLLRAFAIYGWGISLVTVWFAIADGEPLWLLVATWIVFLTSFAWAGTFSKVELTSAGVEIRNDFRVVRVPWPEFERFRLARYGKQCAGHVETTDRRMIRCAVLRPHGLLSAGEALQPLMDRLNERAARIQAEHDS